MEEFEDILLNSLSNSGVPIPQGVSAVKDLTPSTLFEVCYHAFRLIDGGDHLPPLPPSLPEDSMSDRVKSCTEIASVFKDLGFIAELSFRKFLNPSEQDLSELVRFLVGRLSEFSESGTYALGDGNQIGTEESSDARESLQKEEVFSGLKDLSLKPHVPESSSLMKSQDDLTQKSDISDQRNLVSSDGVIRIEESTLIKLDFSPITSSGDDQKGSSQRVESSGKNGTSSDDIPQANVLQNLQIREEIIEKQIDAKYSELQQTEQDFELSKEAVEMVFDGQHPIEFHIEQLNSQLEAKRHRLKELESKWNTTENSLQEKKRNLEQSLFELNPEACENIRRRKQMGMETESVLAEIKRREEEICKLSSDLEKEPKLAPRRSYIERINETTKNSRKLDTDIQRILKDTRELQLESNTIQERLNRTYAVVDETILREAKKDPIARQAYRLLTKIHQSFEQIAEDILATDRCRREAADYEAKLASVRARNLNTNKVQEDLEAIKKEKDLIEQKL